MKLRTLFAVTAVLAPVLAAAHSEKIGRNGGAQVDAGNFHVELVARDAGVTVYVLDHSEKPVATAGFKGLAILVVDGKPQRIALSPDGDNRLSGTAPVPLPAKPKGAVQITPPAGGTVQGRFN